jgi:diguanylate cyclase (GGDEF)-like protein
VFGVAVTAASLVIAGSVLMIVFGDIGRVDLLRVVAFTTLAVFASWFMPRLRIGGSRHSQSLTDSTIIFGLIFLPGPWVILAIAAATAVGKSLARFATGRVVFNTAKDVMTVFVAAVAGWLCDLGSPFHTTAATLGRIVIVALIAIATDEAISVPAIALTSGQRARDVWATYAPLRLAVAMIRMGGGIAAGYLLNSQPRIAIALPVLVIALHLAYANRLQQRVDRLAWSRLSQLVDAVSTGDPHTVRLSAVHGTAELFACADVELVLRTRANTDVMLRGDARAITYVGPAASAPDRAGVMIVAPLGSTEPWTATVGYRSPSPYRNAANASTAADSSGDAAAGDARTPGGGDLVGELRLRFLMPVTFREQEQHTLRALAAAVGAALRKAGAVSAAEQMATNQPRAATHDPLTGLANRTYLLEHGLAGMRRKAGHADLIAEPHSIVQSGESSESADVTGLGVSNTTGHDLPGSVDDRRDRAEDVPGSVDDRPDMADGAPVGTAAPIADLVGLAVVDLIDFKQINEALGQSVGDQVLIAVGRRLAERVGVGELVARVSGDEFAVLLTSVGSTAGALARTRDLLAAIAQPLTVDGVRLGISATAGVAVELADGDLGELLRRADVAVAQAKLDGLRMTAYAPNRDTADVGRLVLGADLTRAVARREFTIAFQPVVDLETGMIRSAEALARWPHPKLGQLSPHQFLDGIERSGLLAGFTDHILDQALAGARTWTDAGFEVPVAVNVSPRSLLDAGFPALISTALDRYHLPPSALIIELTETLTLSTLGVVDEVLHTLRELGVMLALDDFGTGYSSFATVARVPVDELKIDRSFVAGLAGARESAIVRSTIELGRNLGILVVAEGIESDEQRERLWTLGCAAGQGHLFSRPVPAERLILRLRRGHDGMPGRFVAPMHGGDVIRLPSSRRPPEVRRGELS